jgi:acyl-CoA thioester hydrolase
MTDSHSISIRVRYPETDPMGYLHHSRFLQYFEMGRIELLRATGISYADLERAGVFFAVVKAEVRYKSPVRFDDELILITRVTRKTHVRIEHAYELRRGELVVAEGATTIASVDREGSVIVMPAEVYNASLDGRALGGSS